MEKVSLLLFATLPAPGHAKTRLPRDPGGQLCSYLRHVRLRGPANRPTRSSGRQIGPYLRGNGTGVSAISKSKARVFRRFREQGAIFLERLVKGQRGSRGFSPE